MKKHGCQWELYWVHGLQGNWKAAMQCMENLVAESFWSPAVVKFLYAIVLVRPY